MAFNIENFDVSQLSFAERMSLISKLWDSVENEVSNIPFTKEQMEEIDRRIEAYNAGEMGTSSWDDVKKRLDIS